MKNFLNKYNVTKLETTKDESQLSLEGYKRRILKILDENIINFKNHSWNLSNRMNKLIIDGESNSVFTLRLGGKRIVRYSLEYLNDQQKLEFLSDFYESVKQGDFDEDIINFIAEENYPQYGTNFWGGSAENNYGFGTSNIKQNIENVTNQLNNNANNGQITTNSDYTVNTESLVGKPSSYFQSNNTYSSATGRAIENVAGAVTSPNTTSYVTQNAYTPSPTYGASKATGYQIQTPSAFASQPTNQSANIAPNTTSSPIMEPINRYLASVSPQYTAPF